MRVRPTTAYDHGMHLPQAETFKTDAIIAFGLAAISILQIVAERQSNEVSATRVAFAIVMVIAITAPMSMRRAAPTQVAIISSLFWIVDRVTANPVSTLGVFAVIIAHAIGSELPIRRSARFGGGFVLAHTAFTIVGATVQEDIGIVSVISTFGFLSAALALGQEVHKTRTYAARIEEPARKDEALRNQELEEGIRAERARIARELHDVVGHQMTVMTLQAAGANRMIDHDPARAHEALKTVEEAGHQAMAELRRLLSFLRTDHDDLDHDPQPGIGSIQDLIGQMRDSGLDARFAVEGERRHLPTGVSLSVYRIVQESLTNSLRHGGVQVTAEVVINFQSDAVELTISDNGDGAAHDLARVGGSGLGLIGIQERANLLDGTLEAGPRPGGGYRVRVRIPDAQ